MITQDSIFSKKVHHRTKKLSDKEKIRRLKLSVRELEGRLTDAKKRAVEAEHLLAAQTTSTNKFATEQRAFLEAIEKERLDRGRFIQRLIEDGRKKDELIESLTVIKDMLMKHPEEISTFVAALNNVWSYPKGTSSQEKATEIL